MGKRNGFVLWRGLDSGGQRNLKISNKEIFS